MDVEQSGESHSAEDSLDTCYLCHGSTEGNPFEYFGASENFLELHWICYACNMARLKAYIEGISYSMFTR